MRVAPSAEEAAVLAFLADQYPWAYAWGGNGDGRRRPRAGLGGDRRPSVAVTPEPCRPLHLQHLAENITPYGIGLLFRGVLSRMRVSDNVILSNSDDGAVEFLANYYDWSQPYGVNGGSA